MTNELIAKAKECKSADELLALAKENGLELTAEEAAESFAQIHLEGELADDELDAASGGACHTTVDGVKYTVTTCGNKCFTGCYEKCYVGEVDPTLIRGDHAFLRGTWYNTAPAGECCGNCLHLEFKAGTGYCGMSGK